MSYLTFLHIISTKHQQIYLSLSKHLAREVINTSRQAQSRTTQCLRGSPPLIQVDIGGHPPFPNGSKQFFWPFWQFTIFSRFSLPGPF
jgi:hypothetical protein